MLFKGLYTFVFCSLLAASSLGHPGEVHTPEQLKREALERRDFLQHSRRALAESCSGSPEQRRALSHQVALKRARKVERLRAQKRREKMAKRSSCKRADSDSATSSATSTSASVSASGTPSFSGNATATRGPGGPPSGSGGPGGNGGGGSATADEFTEQVLSTSHHSNVTGITANSTTESIFGTGDGVNSTCLLQPEVTIGPYWVAGELVRNNVAEDQAGVPLYLDAQFLDISTCQPVPELYWEIWHCNATGVYSGVVAKSNGDSSDASNINTTFLRGLAKSDELGAVTFESIFPGHYTGRAPHIHVVGHANATLLSNNTIGTTEDSAVHIGQIFFDQDLISEVEKTAPYTSNTQDLMLNENDSILISEAQQGAPDPFLNYVYLGDEVEDGIFAWITLGVNASASYQTRKAATLYEGGGVASSNTGGGF